MDGGVWWATVHGFAKSLTRLSDFTFFHFSHPAGLILGISPKETTTQRALLKL